MTSSSRYWRKQLTLGLCLLLVAVVGQAAADVAAPGDRERQIRAALVYKVARFVTWPESSFANAGDFNLCFVGDGAVARAMAGIEGRLIQRRAVRLRQLEVVGQLVIGQCNLLYLGGRSSLTPESFEAARDSAVLVIADDSLSRAMVALIERDNRMRLAIDLGEVRAAQLRVDAPLLQLVEVRQ